MTTIGDMVDEVIAENPRSVEDCRANRGHALTFLIGQLVRKSKGLVSKGLAHSLLSSRVEPTDKGVNKRG